MIKMVIAMRTDLDMNRGKMCAQAGHASLMGIIDSISFSGAMYYDGPVIFLDKQDISWLQDGMTKIAVAINSLEELEALETKCFSSGLKCFSVTDRKLGVKTCCAIGPDEEEKIDKITRSLPLLR